MRAEALKGHLDLLLLAVLADGDAHGYAVIEALRVRGGFEAPEGTIYPALHRLPRAPPPARRTPRPSPGGPPRVGAGVRTGSRRAGARSLPRAARSGGASAGQCRRSCRDGRVSGRA